MELKDLTPEQRARLDSCEGPEEILAFAKAEGVELNDEELEAVSGGAWIGGVDSCPSCGSKGTTVGAGGARVCGECGTRY